MKIACIILLPLLLAGVAHGQDMPVVEDTLDWQRYYPLEVGNTWEYGGLDRYTSTIVGDTLANGHRYFIRRDSIPAAGTLGPFIQTFYLRYDTAGTVLTLPDLEADTVEVTLPVRYNEEGFQVYLDLKASFGDTLYYVAPDTLYYVWGGYNEVIEVGYASVEVDALKCFRLEGVILGNACYATDIGFVWGGNLFGSRLEYARVNGVEYGSPPSTPVEAAAVVPERFSIETIYPNPFKDRAAVVYRLPKPSSITVEVFNVLGQRIWWEGASVQASESGRYELQNREWPAGIYYVRLTTERGEQSMRTVVVTQ